MKQIYCCVPESMLTKPVDRFDYKLRSMDEIEEQMKYFPPDFVIDAAYKRYTAGDRRQHQYENPDDRERVSKLTFDIRQLNLAPL